jgi:two-component system KDP operon response regulator KdpE
VPIKILVIDDDQILLHFLKEYLERVGYEYVSADRGPKGLRVFFEERPDLVVLDVMMPGMDGWEVCARIRELSETPILMLTAKSSEVDKLRGFNLGVDDYVTKPFSLEELGARIRAILARTEVQREGEITEYRVGTLVIDMRKREASQDGQLLNLTPTEFRLLAALTKRVGEAISQDDLITEVWGGSRRGGGNALRRYIWLLRRKIEADPKRPTRLVTVRGYGYRLDQ